MKRSTTVTMDPGYYECARVLHKDVENLIRNLHTLSWIFRRNSYPNLFTEAVFIRSKRTAEH